MKAAVVESVDRIVVKQVRIPDTPPDMVLVQVKCAGLCGPTDDAILRGYHPRAKFPLILGHEFSGVVAETGSLVTTVRRGEPVVVNPLISCGVCVLCREGNSYICERLGLIGIDADGGFAEYCLVPGTALVKIPLQLPHQVAALSEPLAVGIHSVREAGLTVGHRALIFGAGPIGMLTAEACRIAGAADITLVDINERRLGMARALGYATARDALALRDDVKFDFVFETTGASAVLEPALHMVRIKGTVVIVGKYDIDPPFDLHTVLFKEITVKGARVYREGEFLTAVRLLASDPHRFGRLITDCFALDEAELMIGAFRSKSNVGKLMIIM